MLHDAVMFFLIGFTLPFCLFTLMNFVFQGRVLLNWSSGTVKSGVTNLVLALANGMLAAGVYVMIDGLQATYDALRLPHVDSSVWQGTPFILVVLLYIVAHDFSNYWCHRALHGRTLWPIHAVHHSETDMNFTTSFRVHLLEAVVMNVFYIAFLSWLGLPAEAGASLAILMNLYNKFVHMDADIHFGPLNKILATPRFHRWHHADDPVAYNTNFANIFSFFDVVFGTYYVPGPYRGPLGFEGSPGHNPVGLMMLPFRLWWQDRERYAQVAHKAAASVRRPSSNAPA